MKKIRTYIRDIYIFLVTILGVSFLYRTQARKSGPLVRVVVFHDVTDKIWFTSMIAYMKKRYHILSPEAFFSQSFEEGKINVLVTFDDGYDSWVSVCAPVLREYGVKGLFFINSGLIDTNGSPSAQAQYLKENLLLRRPRNILSWEGLGVLKTEGHTIGGHTVSHARLSQLSREEQEKEVVEDKQILEQHLECTVTAFAYPFGRLGDYTAESREVVRTSRYTHAFTTEASFVSMQVSDMYAIPRLCIEDNLTPHELGHWIEGGYDLYMKIKKVCAG